MEVSVTVNGVVRSADVEARTLLVHLLRDELGLTGTNIGCDTSSCGACTVLVDGLSAKSCTLLAVQVLVFVAQRDSGHNHARGAEPALEAVAILEGLLHGVQAVVASQALDGREFCAVYLDGQQCAGLGRKAVDQHGAGSAGTGVATDVGAGEPQFVTQ